jgi:hypothetical protein
VITILTIILNSPPVCIAVRCLNIQTCDTCCAGVDSSLHNYVLLGLALFQFPFMYYLGIRPSAVVALKPK